MTTTYKPYKLQSSTHLLTNFIQILLVVLLVAALGIILGEKGIPIRFTALDQMVDDFPYRLFLTVITFAAAGDESVRDNFFQSLTILVTLAFIQETVHIVGGEPLISQNSIYVDVVVLSGVVVTCSKGNGDKGTENKYALHLDIIAGIIL